MPRTNTPSPKKNRNHNKNDIDDEDDHFEAMPIRQSMNSLMPLTAPDVRDGNTPELEKNIDKVMRMNDNEIRNELQRSFNNNDEKRTKRLITGLFRGYQNFSFHYLALQKNNKKFGRKHQIDDMDMDHDQNEDEDEDEDEEDIMNRKNSKKGEMAFMNKSVSFFKEFCKLINSPNPSDAESNWINRAISIYLDEVK